MYLDFFSSIVPIKSCSGMHSVRWDALSTICRVKHLVAVLDVVSWSWSWFSSWLSSLAFASSSLDRHCCVLKLLAFVFALFISLNTLKYFSKSFDILSEHKSFFGVLLSNSLSRDERLISWWFSNYHRSNIFPSFFLFLNKQFHLKYFNLNFFTLLMIRHPEVFDQL